MNEEKGIGDQFWEFFFFFNENWGRENRNGKYRRKRKRSEVVSDFPKANKSGRSRVNFVLPPSIHPFSL